MTQAMDEIEAFLKGCTSSFTVWGWADFPAGSLYRTRNSVWELVLVTRGSMSWELGQEVHEVAEGDLCLVPGGRPELRRWRDDRPSRHAYLHFRVGNEAARILADTGVAWVRRATDCAAARSEFYRLLERIAAEGFAPIVALAQFRLVLALHLCPEGNLTSHRPAGHSPLIAAAAHDLQAIWGREGISLLPLARWAAAMGCSREHLCRSFRRDLDCTPQEFMQALRSRQAVHLLRSSHLRVKQIASLLGFGDATNLARLLRQHYGLGPRSLRRWLTSHPQPPPSRLPLPLLDGVSLFWDPSTLRLEC